MIRKLQIKFVVINMAMVTVMLCVIFGLVYNFTRNSLEAESISMMRSIADDPFRQGRPDDHSPDLRLPYFTVQIGQRGEILSTGGGYFDLSDEAFLTELISEVGESKRETGIFKEHGLRFCRMGTPRGTVIVFADMSSENSTLDNLVKTSVVIGVFSFLVFLGTSIFLSRWAVKPVSRAWQQQKQFVADASHELKTPLTVIMTDAELLESGCCSEEEQRRFSGGILIMARQMRQLLEKMLELARADSEQTKIQMTRLDLSRLVLDETLSFEGVFVEKGLGLDSRVEEGIFIHGSFQQLQQLLGILLDNAQKYSSPGGETVLSLESAPQGKCRIKVSNPGAEIPADELKNIFRRFYRMDKARSRDGSFGLGLSIAESIAAQHKGKIWAESRAGVNTFTVELHKTA